MSTEQNKTKKEPTLEELIQRAKTADHSQKFPISSNYYFVIFSRHLTELAKSKTEFNNLILRFILSAIMLKSQNQQEKMLNFLLANEKLNTSMYKKLFEKFLNYQLITKEDIDPLYQNLQKNLKSSFEGFDKLNFNRAIFEHNIFSLSRVFENISFNSLEKFLNMKINDILVWLLSFFMEGNWVNGHIDESKKCVFFERVIETENDYDGMIRRFCTKAKILAEYVKKNSNSK